MKRILAIVLLTLMTVSFFGCQREEVKTIECPAYTQLGQGEKEFMFTVTGKDGETEGFLIHTDEKTVGQALLNLGIIEGEDGPYGLFVKKVNGERADYDKDKVYWAFYIDGEYATHSVDKTEIEEGKVYAFKVTKA